MNPLSNLIFVSVALCGLGAAATTEEVLTLAVPDRWVQETQFTDPENNIYLGSIIDVKPTATTLALECLHAEPDPVHGFCLQMGIVTVVTGPSTFAADFVLGGSIIERQTCTGSASPTCMLAQTSVSASPYTEDGIPRATGPMTATIVNPSFSDIPVTITRGRDKLVTATDGTETAAKTGTGTASKTKTRDESGYITLTGTVTPTTTPTTTPTVDDETPTSTGAAARMTCAAQWVVWGMAVAALAGV